MPKPNNNGGGKPVEEPAPVLPVIDGSAGSDIITPELDADFVTTDEAEEIYGNAGVDLISAGGGNDIVYGGTESDVISGDAGDDTLNGDEGDDTIDGGVGNDTINGGIGNDTIIGGDGNDTIDAGDGNDLIIAGNGSDDIDGGDGNDTLVYGGILDVDYTLTEIYGKGKNKDVIISYEVFKIATGETDTITNVETIEFTSPVLTSSDAAIIEADETAVLDVLANDVQVGSDPGVGLTLTAIYDAPLLGLDLIPQAGEDDISYFYGGGALNDGTMLYVDEITGVITWDPLDVYETEPAPGDPDPSLYFFYDVEGQGGEVATGDVGVQIVYPPDPVPGTVIDFETVLDFGIYSSTTLDTTYFLYQLSTASPLVNPLAPFELRDRSVTDFDYDDDGDLEWRIWTDDDGPNIDLATTHQFNMTQADYFEFNVASVNLSGFDDGETVYIETWYIDEFGVATSNGTTIDNTDIAPDGTYNIIGGDGIVELVLVAGVGDEVFVDDIVIG